MTVKISGNSSSSTPSFAGDDGDSGLHATADQVQLVTNGTVGVTVDSSQNVGIGTTTPNYELHVHDSGTGTVDSRIHLTNGDTGTGGGDGFHIIANGSTANYAVNLLNRENGPLALWTNNAQRLTVDSSGNVGIGATTPTYNLDVESSGDTVIRARSSTTANPSFILSEDNNTKWQIESVNNSDNRLRIINQSSSEVVTVDQSGNVGFGKTSSGNKLEIEGQGDTKIVIDGRTDAANGSDAVLELWSKNSSGTNNFGFIDYDGDGNFEIGSGGSGAGSVPLVFKTNNTERMRIESNGYVSTPNNSSSGLQIGYQKLQSITGSFSANTWYDTGIDRTTDTGIFEVDLFVDTWQAGGQSYSMRYTGWFVMHSGASNSTDASYIDLHRTGHAPNNETIQLRTVLTPNYNGSIKLQWLSNYGLTLTNSGGRLLRVALRRFASTQ